MAVATALRLHKSMSGFLQEKVPRLYCCYRVTAFFHTSFHKFFSRFIPASAFIFCHVSAQKLGLFLYKISGQHYRGIITSALSRASRKNRSPLQPALQSPLPRPGHRGEVGESNVHTVSDGTNIGDMVGFVVNYYPPVTALLQ